MKAQIPVKQSGRPRKYYKYFVALKVNQCTKPLPANAVGSAAYWEAKLKMKFAYRNTRGGMIRVYRVK